MAEYKAALEEQGWEYRMKVSFVEIYCEKIRDLLRESGPKKGAKYDIDHKVTQANGGTGFKGDVASPAAATAAALSL